MDSGSWKLLRKKNLAKVKSRKAENYQMLVFSNHSFHRIQTT